MRGEREEAGADAAPRSCSQTPTLFLLEYVHHVHRSNAPVLQEGEAARLHPPHLNE